MYEADNHALWSETRGEKCDAAVVLLHGFTGSHFTWEKLCRRLAEDHFLIVPDLPGHGRSGTTSDSTAMNMNSTSESILRLLDQSRVQKTAMLGYSLGGRIALHFALRYQDRLSCLILESASPGIQGSKEREERRLRDDLLAGDIERYGLNWFVDKWENMELFATQKNLDPATFERTRKERLSHTASGLAMSLRSLGTGTMQPLWSQLDRLRIPVLLIVGEEDERFMKIAKDMKGRMTNCDIKVVTNAGHATHLENPEMFEGIVTQFIDTYQPSGEDAR